MINKLYEKFKSFMKENWKYIITLIVCYFIFSFPVPYYIYTGGGTININDRIEIETTKKTEGSLNFAYVRELHGNVANFLLAHIIPKWDIEKEEEMKLSDEETMQDIEFRNRIYLENANQSAIFLAYQKAEKKVATKDAHFYVLYVEKQGENGLKVGDEILEVNGVKLTDLNYYTSLVEKANVGDSFNVLVERKGKEEEVVATVKDYDGKKLTGVTISTIYEYETEPELSLSFEKNESGPSGGLMLTLAIYNKLVEEDITKGYKIVGTGTISSDGTVGEIGGVKYKLQGAVAADADIFLVPAGENYGEALDEASKNDYDIQIKAVSTFDQALDILSNLKEK